MKALVYTGPEGLDFRDAPEPEPGQGEALIRVESVGICGSDMHAYLGHDERRPAPLILGHEAAGTVLDGALKGRRVTVNPLVTCGKCPACLSGRDNLCATRQIISMPPREGAFAELLKMPEGNLVEIPDGVSMDKAALAEPVACGWHAVRLGREVLKPEGAITALVIGGGAIGLGAALSLAAQGKTETLLVEPNAERRAFLNAQCGVNAVTPEDVPAERMFDIVIDGVGYEATRAMASAHARPGGVIMHIGLGSATGGLDIRRLTLQEIAFIGTYTYTAEDFRQTAEAIFTGRLGPLDWVETRPLSEGASAFTSIRAGKIPSPKIILKP